MGHMAHLYPVRRTCCHVETRCTNLNFDPFRAVAIGAFPCRAMHARAGGALLGCDAGHMYTLQLLRPFFLPARVSCSDKCVVLPEM
jgi:hypothetical protein